MNDLRYAIRQITRNPGYALVAVLTLALGIGANTTIFSAVNAVLLRPLPFPESDRLVQLFSLHDGEEWTASPPDFVDWREGNRTLVNAVAINTSSFALTGDGPAERVRGARVTDGFLSILRVPPVLGRAFRADEMTVGQDRVALVSHDLWERRYGGDPGIIGRDIRVDGVSHTVVGVMPEGFSFPSDAEIWVPLAFTTDDLTTQRGAHYLNVVGRLKPGSTVEGARAELSAIARRLEERYPDSNTGYGAAVQSLRESVVGDVRPAMLVLIAAVGLLLLIACANVANLFLARAIGRGRELAIRTALGAGRGRLIRSLLTESLVLALAGGAVGLLLALWGTELMTTLQTGTIPRLDEARVDGMVLAFTLIVSLLTALVFGLFPALHASSFHDMGQRLKEGGRGLSGERSGRRAKSGLVIAETGIAVMLVVSAGLLIRSFVRLQAVDPGFETRNLLTFNVSLPEARYTDPESYQRFSADLLDRIEALPGVEGAAGVFGLPLSGFRYSINFTDVDGVEPASPEDEISTQVRVVTPGYFRVMGIPFVRGRGITPSDRADAPPVAVINESAARLAWPDGDPIGRSFHLGTSFGLGRGRAGGEVVGVVRDVKEYGLDASARPEVFLTNDQFPMDYFSIVVRSPNDPRALIEPIRSQLHALDPEVPMFAVQTMERLVRLSLAQPRFYMLLLAVFATTALALAALGIYGVIAYAVAGRTREIGIRLALGAQRRDVLGMVLRQGLALAGAGLLLGLLGSLGATRLLADLLFGVRPTDAPTFVGVAALLLVVALAATYVPARRAASTDPIDSLRQE